MAHIDDMIARVDDPALRAQIERALGDIKKQLQYGLVFERHMPETVRLNNLPIRLGDVVAVRTEPKSVTTYTVRTIAGKGARLAADDGGPDRTVALSNLQAIKRFGEPIYPALESVERLERGGDKPFHAVINAENFHAVQLLTYVYEGQVDCLYLDPPYNTGAKDWKYNNDYVDKKDGWRHSKWLSFMDRRLRLARRLLKPDGILILTIDENEHAHVLMLLEQLFKQHDLTSITVMHNPRGVQGNNFSYTHEYAIFVIPRGMKAVVQKVREGSDAPTLRKWGNDSTRDTAKNCFYPIYLRDGEIVGFGEVADDGYHPAGPNEEQEDGTVAVWPLDGNLVERKWRYARQSVEEIRPYLVPRTTQKGHLDVGLAKDFEQYRTVWQHPKYDASMHGTQLVNAFIGKPFPYPKSLYSVYECLYSVLANRPDALVVDFFAGSGTTLHATMLLNTADGGRRRCVLVTNNEVEAKAVTRLHKAGLYAGDPDFEAEGIFEQITRPRTVAAVTGTATDGTELVGTYLDGDGRAWADGFEENVELFRLRYLDRDEVDLGLQFDAILPALWLSAGGVGTREHGVSDQPMSVPDSSNYAVLFKPSRVRALLAALKDRPDITTVYVVTDSEDVFAQVRADLPAGCDGRVLYAEYLRNFRINTEQNL